MLETINLFHILYENNLTNSKFSTGYITLNQWHSLKKNYKEYNFSINNSKKINIFIDLPGKIICCWYE